MAVLRSQHALTVSTPEGNKQLAYQLWQPMAKTPQQLIVCVHGLTRNSRDFDFLAQQLAADAWVVCPDIIGRGDSDWLDNSNLYGYPLYLSLMVQLLTELQQQFSVSECDWVGTSMGGLIGMMLSASDEPLPLAIRQLVLNDVGHRIPFAALSRIGEYVGQSPRFASLDEAELYLRHIARSFGPLTAAQWRHLTQHSCQPQQDDAGGCYWQLKYDPGIARAFLDLNGDVDLSVVWQQVQQPVLLLRGEQSDLLLAETADEMASRPGVTLVQFSQVGHAPMLMDEEQIACVQSFLQ